MDWTCWVQLVFSRAGLVAGQCLQEGMELNEVITRNVSIQHDVTHK